jgi:uncharacterized GH25 family protein
MLRITTRSMLLSSALCLAGLASAHTLFIKPDSFIVEPNQPISVSVINGTFLKSENRIKEPMTRSAEIIGPGGAEYDFASDDWVSVGKTSVLSAQFADPGNYIIAITTQPQKVTLDADTFNYYLRFEGLVEQKDEREKLGESDFEVVETYRKFAKAIVQVGGEQTSSYATELGFDVEIVPMTNPYTLQVGDVFQARVMRDGEPINGMRVFATHEGYLPQDDEGIYDELVKVISDENGVVEFEITDPGKWYLRFIDLRRESDSEYWYSDFLASIGADEKRIVYESEWATLTFEIQ